MIEDLRETSQMIGEVIQYARDGRRVTLLCRWSMDYDDQGNPASILTTGTDITKRLTHEKLLRLEAEAANRANDLFLATLSHELRTHLNAIVGWANILQIKGGEDEELMAGLDVILRNCKAQTKLIEDVLDLSRIVSGKLRLDIAPCDYAGSIRAAMESVMPSADLKGIKLEAELDPSATGGRCDAARIQQVVWNLLTNAIKFTPESGTVRVTLSRKQSKTRITVHDTGRGISAEFLPHVFDRFRQADASSARNVGGLGLGVSISKHIVELHGGTIHAKSAGESPSSGAIFTIELPMGNVCTGDPPVQDDEAQPHRASPPPEANLTKAGEQRPFSSARPGARLDGRHVLVVEDEPDARLMMTKILQDAGAMVTAAAGVNEALEVLKAMQRRPIYW